MYIKFWFENLKRPFTRHRRKWEDNIRMNLREIGWYVVDWIIWLRLSTSGGLYVNMVMNFRVPCKAGNFLTG
jgi:hypothetical protein